MALLSMGEIPPSTGTNDLFRVSFRDCGVLGVFKGVPTNAGFGFNRVIAAMTLVEPTIIARQHAKLLLQDGREELFLQWG